MEGNYPQEVRQVYCAVSFLNSLTKTIKSTSWAVLSAALTVGRRSIGIRSMWLASELVMLQILVEDARAYRLVLTG